MKKHIFGLKASKFMKFLLVSLAAFSNFYGLLLLGRDEVGWDPFILGSIVLLGLSYISSICEKHFKSKIKDLIIGLISTHFIEQYKNQENTEEIIEPTFKMIGTNVIVMTFGEVEKKMALSQDKEGFYLTELPNEIEFNGLRVLKENLEISNVKVSLDVVSNKSIVTSIEKADDK